MVRKLLFCGLGCSLLLTVSATLVAAVPPSEQLLPAATKAYVSVPHVPNAFTAWERTPLGQLLNDQQMEAFVEDLRAQLHDKGALLEDRMGISLHELEGLPSGELALALVEMPDKQAAGILLMDVSGNLQVAEATLKKVDKQLLGADSKKEQRESKSAQTKLIIYTVPPKGTRKEPIKAVYFLYQGLLGVSDNVDLVEDVLNRHVTEAKDGLRSAPLFQLVSERCAAGDAGKFDVSVRWWVDPLAAASAVQNRMKDKLGGTRDWVKILHKEFAAIQAAGGVVGFAPAPYGVLHASYIHAPPPYERAMRMAKFPNVDKFPVPSWVPATVNSYTTFAVDLLNAFDHFGTLFNEVVGEGEEGVWEDVLDSIKTDPNGPQLDLRNDLVVHLGQRLVVTIDTEDPITPHSQRRLLAAEAKDEAKLAAAVERSMQGDKNVKVLEVDVEGKKHKIFEMIPEDAQLPEVNLQVVVGDQKPDAAAPVHKPPHQAVTVAHGWLFVSTHVNLLEQIIRAPQAPRCLDSVPEYQHVVAHLEKLHPAEHFVHSFARDDEQMRVAYELFRKGQLPEADLPLSEALNAIFASETPEGEVRKPKLDGRKLPDFAVVRKYIGTSGVIATSEEKGWYVVGFALDKTNPQAMQAQRPKVAD